MIEFMLISSLKRGDGRGERCGGAVLIPPTLSQLRNSASDFRSFYLEVATGNWACSDVPFRSSDDDGTAPIAVRAGAKRLAPSRRPATAESNGFAYEAYRLTTG